MPQTQLPIEDAGHADYASLGHARHVAARLENGVTIHNFYVPAGGDVPDREVNEKFARVENIRKFRMIPKALDHEDGELTATQKVKRSSMMEMFGDLVEDMYR